MLKKSIEEAINKQINAEFWSGYLYLSMACHFEDAGRPGVANWFRIQFKEELAHAKIFINYVNSRGGRVTLEPIAEVPNKWNNEADAFAATLAHEEKVTSMINELYALAESEHDYATREKLNWFVAEQVEEEETARQLLDDYRLIGDNGNGLYNLDRELATRTYTAPAILGE